MTKHSPTPWKYKPEKTLRDSRGITTHLGAEITDANDERCIAIPPVVRGGDSNWSANSEFIVRACNNHESLLAALRQALRVHFEICHRESEPWTDAAHRAIAKAEEK